jgi:hypothetical protein
MLTCVLVRRRGYSVKEVAEYFGRDAAYNSETFSAQQLHAFAIAKTKISAATTKQN